VKKHHIVHMHLANYDSSCIGFTVLSLQIFINFYHSLFIYAASARVLRHVPLYQPVGFHTLLNEAVNSTCAWFWWKAWNKKIYRGLFLSKSFIKANQMFDVKSQICTRRLWPVQEPILVLLVWFMKTFSAKYVTYVRKVYLHFT